MYPFYSAINSVSMISIFVVPFSCPVPGYTDCPVREVQRTGLIQNWKRMDNGRLGRRRGGGSERDLLHRAVDINSQELLTLYI